MRGPPAILFFHALSIEAKKLPTENSVQTQHPVFQVLMFFTMPSKVLKKCSVNLFLSFYFQKREEKG
jgi:hypothetical protein